MCRTSLLVVAISMNRLPRGTNLPRATRKSMSTWSHRAFLYRCCSDSSVPRRRPTGSSHQPRGSTNSRQRVFVQLKSNTCTTIVGRPRCALSRMRESFMVTYGNPSNTLRICPIAPSLQPPYIGAMHAPDQADLLTLLGTGLAVIGADLRVTWLNPALGEVLDVGPRTAVGQPLPALMRE